MCMCIHKQSIINKLKSSFFFTTSLSLFLLFVAIASHYIAQADFKQSSCFSPSSARIINVNHHYADIDTKLGNIMKISNLL